MAGACNDRSYSDEEEVSHKCIDCQIVFYENEDSDSNKGSEVYICGDCLKERSEIYGYGCRHCSKCKCVLVESKQGKHCLRCSNMFCYDCCPNFDCLFCGMTMDSYKAPESPKLTPVGGSIHDYCCNCRISLIIGCDSW